MSPRRSAGPYSPAQAQVDAEDLFEMLERDDGIRSTYEGNAPRSSPRLAPSQTRLPPFASLFGTVPESQSRYTEFQQYALSDNDLSHGSAYSCDPNFDAKTPPESVQASSAASSPTYLYCNLPSYSTPLQIRNSVFHLPYLSSDPKAMVPLHDFTSPTSTTPHVAYPPFTWSYRKCSKVTRNSEDTMEFTWSKNRQRAGHQYGGDSGSSSLENHLPKKFVCPYPPCGRHFARLNDQRRHSRIHTNERPYRCSTCGKEFRRSDAKKRHELKQEC